MKQKNVISSTKKSYYVLIKKDHSAFVALDPMTGLLFHVDDITLAWLRKDKETLEEFVALDDTLKLLKISFLIEHV